jgi:hypothetical protein
MCMKWLVTRLRENALSNYLRNQYRYLSVGVFGRVHPNVKRFGSCSLVKHEAGLVVLTAMHVVESVRSVGSTVHIGPKTAVVPGPWQCKQRSFDLAVSLFQPQYIADRSYDDDGHPGHHSLQELERAEFESEFLNTDFYFAHSVAGPDQHPLPGGRELKTTTLPMLMRPADSVYSWFDPSIHFAVSFTPGRARSVGGKRIAKDPHGFSGSLCWAVHRDPKGKFIRATVAGVLHTWDDVAQSLVGTRVEHVKEFLDCAWPLLQNVPSDGTV